MLKIIFNNIQAFKTFLQSTDKEQFWTIYDGYKALLLHSSAQSRRGTETNATSGMHS